MSPRFLKRGEAAEMLNMKVESLDYLVRSNQIPFHRLGKRLVRFDRERLENWLTERQGIPYRKVSRGK